MCGVGAFFVYRDAAHAAMRGELERSAARMQCRGPDGEGMWVHEDGFVGLAHRRLAIIDLSERGAQPMATEDDGVVISFNGEIVNYKELRAELEACGEEFTSQSDTEVVLRLYRRCGARMLPRLRGMFAFVIWDARRGGVLLARDPFGVKPLYYADDGRAVRVASEVKALLAGGGVDTRPNPAAHVGFFLWGSVPEPHTLFRGINALPAGSAMWVDNRGPHAPFMYADLRGLLADAESRASAVDGEDLEAVLRDGLQDTVRRHLVADVEVGVFLSAGLDSSTIAAHASELGGRLRTMTLGFEEFRGTHQDEVPLATEVAKAIGSRHETVWINHREFEAELPRLLDRMDQPTIDGVNSFFVARAASHVGLKVALSGLGGDELFGGYPSYRHLPQIVSLVRSLPFGAQMGRGVRVVTAPLIRRLTSPKYAGMLEYGGTYEGAYLLRRGLFLPWELPSVLDADIVRDGWAELEPLLRLQQSIEGLAFPRSRVCALETGWYMRNQLLRDTDWASMAHSVEVRVPLVDWSLWQRIAPIAAHVAHLDKRMMARTTRPALPDLVLRRAKTGFAIPTREWLLRDVKAAPNERGLRRWARYVHAQMAAT